MTTSELKAKLGRLARSPRTFPVRSGSHETVTIRMGPDIRRADSISAMALLKQSGLSLLRAKRTIEAVVPDGVMVVELPKVADAAALERDFADHGFSAKVRSRDVPNVQVIRETLGLTQEQFALRFGLDVDAVRNWEHARRTPDTAAQSLLKVIARHPDLVAEAQDN